MSEVTVLDSSAVLAFLQGERGSDVLEAAFTGASAWISSVNLCEVLGKLLDRGIPGDEVREAVDELGLHVVEFGAADALRTAALRPPTRSIGASLGDRACLALALAAHEAGDTPTVLTADRLWTKVRWPFKIILIR